MVVRAWVAAAALAVAVTGVCVPVWADPPAGEILMRAAESVEDIPHEGRAVTVARGPRGNEARFARDIYSGHQGLREVRIEGPPPQRVVSDGSWRWRVLRDGALAFVAPVPDFALAREQRVERAKRVGQTALVTLEPDGECAGRPVWRLVVHRRIENRWVPARGLIIDKQTYQELGNTTYNRDGEIVASTTYEWIRYLRDDELQSAHFEYDPGEGTLVVPEAGELSAPMPFREAKAQESWIVPLRARPKSWRPEGVALPRFGQEVVAQFLFVDELGGGSSRPRPVLLFEKRRDSVTPFFDSFYRLEGVTAEPRRRRQSVVWADDNLIYVLASTLAPERLAAAAVAHAGQ